MSIAAVSQALNNTGKLNAETRARIQRIASELGYAPNKLAAALRRRTAMSIGFVATTAQPPQTRRSWATVYGAQLNALVGAAAERGFTVTVIPEDRPELLGAAQLDAVYLPDASLGAVVRDEAIKRALPVVTTDTTLHYAHAIRVHTGYAEATVAALDALAESGAQAPAVLSGEPGAGLAEAEQVYVEWCVARGIAPLIAHGSDDQDHLVSTLHEVVRAGADAIFSLVEQGPALYIALERDGMIVPRDMQLVALCVDECAANRRLDISHVCVHPAEAPTLLFESLVTAINSGAGADIRVPWQYHAGSTTRPVLSAA